MNCSQSRLDERLKKRQRSGALALTLLICGWVVPSACVNKKNREQGELRSITVRSKADAGLDMILLRSMGIDSEVRQSEFVVGRPATTDSSSVVGANFEGLTIQLNSTGVDLLRPLLTLFSQSVQSKVQLSKLSSAPVLSDLMSPAVQALVGRELSFNDPNISLTSLDALLAVLTADASQLRLLSYDKGNLANLLLDGLSFKTVGEIPTASKTVGAAKRERNSGFSVGDLLVFTEKDSASTIQHAALWLDHDIYFEVFTADRSLVFRFASYAQILQQLAPRLAVDVRQMRLTIVRKMVSWGDVLARTKQFKDSRLVGTAQFVLDPTGRASLNAVEGFSLKAFSESSGQKAQ